MRFYVTPGELTKKRNIELLTAADNKIEIHSDTGITKEQLVKLEKALQAKVVYPWSAGYNEDKREFNDVYPANPLLIVYVASYQDIQVCLEFARNYKLTTAIRSGRHSLADYSVCDGMVIDISLLKSVL